MLLELKYIERALCNMPIYILVVYFEQIKFQLVIKSFISSLQVILSNLSHLRLCMTQKSNGDWSVSDIIRKVIECL